MRRLLLATAAAVFLAPAFAADTSGAGRYQLAPSEAGFVRLDTLTGATSHCSKQDDVWRCEPVAEAEGALDAKFDALSGEVSRLSAALSEMAARLDVLAARVDRLAASSVAQDTSPPPKHGLVATAMERLFALVRALKHGERDA
jgi:hypothetical protein